jgi:hypothetical protein
MSVVAGFILCVSLCLGSVAITTIAQAADNQSPEATIRALVRANAEKDMPALSRLVSHNIDITSYSVG